MRHSVQNENRGRHQGEFTPVLRICVNFCEICRLVRRYNGFPVIVGSLVLTFLKTLVSLVIVPRDTGPPTKERSRPTETTRFLALKISTDFQK